MSDAAQPLSIAEVQVEARRISMERGQFPEARTGMEGRQQWRDLFYDAARSLRYWERGVK